MTEFGDALAKAINKSKTDISKFPNGNIKALLSFVEKL